MTQARNQAMNQVIEPSLAAASPAQIADPAEAAAVATHLNEVMDALLDIVDRETALVRDGKLHAVAELETSKSSLARLYIADVTRLRANAPYLEAREPRLLAALKQRHTSFHAQLQVNLTVLATAHAVAEGIVRGVSAEINQKSRPQVYGATGRQVAGRPNQSVPISVARSL